VREGLVLALDLVVDRPTITEKCELTTRAAPSPATEPMQAPITGTSESNATTTSQAGLAGT
jgi:hypothetical protein